MVAILAGHPLDTAGLQLENMRVDQITWLRVCEAKTRIQAMPRFDGYGTWRVPDSQLSVS